MSQFIHIDHKYQIIKNLGSGLSGEVLLVSDPQNNKVALKFLKRVQLNVSRDEALKNFKNEFSILKELNHPNIARILDFGFDEQLQKYYFTTEFIEGAELDKACKNQSLDVVERLVVQVYRALNYLHSRGIHHFDIKPQNILVSLVAGVPQTAKIIDFGLAALTSPQKRVGTPSYMAPEMIQGGLLDNQTDIYSMGVVTYQLLTGQNPFAGKTAKEVLEKQLHHTPEPPSKINAQVPEYWDHIVMRMIEKNPVRRYAQTSLAIRDLNFLSQKDFEAETNDTKLSYLPEKGLLIGRDHEWQRFTEIFGRIFFANEPVQKHLLMITGPKGTGKTRFLSEVKYYSQLKNISVRNWTELQKVEHQTDCVVQIDSPSLTTASVNEFFHGLNTHRCLVIWATEQAPTNWTNSTIITLSPYTQEHLKHYIESVTGLDNAPPQLVDNVLKRTSGNPLCVTEFIKALLEQNVLFDTNGKWDASTFSDVVIDFDKIKIPNSIEDLLTQKWNSLPNASKEILSWMALCGFPLRSADLSLLCEHPCSNGLLASLIKEEIIQSGTDSTFSIKNPLFTDVIMKALPFVEQQIQYDRLTQSFETVPERQRDVLKFRSCGTDPQKAQAALLELGSLLVKEYNYDEAIEVYEKLLKIFSDNDHPEGIEARFKLAEAFVKTRRYDEALVHYEVLKGYWETQPNQRDQLHLTFKKIIDTLLKKSDLAAAERVCCEVLNLLVEENPNTPCLLVFKNFKAFIALKNGAIDEAATLFQETYALWKNQLDPQQKQLVDNNRLLDVYLIRQDYESAARFCLDNIAIFTQLDEKPGMAAYHYALGDVYYQMVTNQKRSDHALLAHKSWYHFETCERIARSIHDYGFMLRAFNGMGNLSNSEEKLDKTIKSYERALTLSRQINDHFTAAIIAFNIGNIFLRQNNIQEAYSYLVYSINTFGTIGREYSPHKEINLYYAYNSLADVYSMRGSFEEAHQTLTKSDELILGQEALKPLTFWVKLSWARYFIQKQDQPQAQRTVAVAKGLMNTKDQQTELEKLMREYEKIFPNQDTFKATSKEPPMSEQINTHKPNENLKKIIEINKFINSEQNTELLLKMVLNYAVQLTGAEAGFVLLLNDDGTFSTKATLNAKEEDEKKISQSIAHRAIEKNEIVVSSDALSDERFESSESVVLNELKSIVCLPIRSKNKSIGVFYLDNRYRINAFDNCDLELLNAFCDQVGIAIENSTLINELVDTKNRLDHKLKQTAEELADVQSKLVTATDQCKHRYSYKHIIAHSQRMQDVFHVLDKVTETNLSVFICGESGTGKELVAKCLHFNNPQRVSKRFVAINCGAIPPNLMESELFGHKAGSFTSASRDQKGLFEEASGGTLFLDEISELEQQLQVKLLRVLQEGEVQRIGDTHTIKVDVRVVCASHKDLSQLTKEGKFREDLYYRLCQMKVDLPPLRERLEDIPLLAKHFVDRFREQNHIKEEIDIPADFTRALLSYHWSGNVRELENLILVSCAMRDGKNLVLENIPPLYGLKQQAVAPAPSIASNLADVPTSSAQSSALIDSGNPYDPSKTWQDYEALILAKAYEFHGKKKATVAKSLGLSHSTIYNKVAELKLDDPTNPLYNEKFSYDPQIDLKNYVYKIFQAALQHHGNHPYAVIKQLNISQGYFYKVMRECRDQGSGFRDQVE